MAEEHPNMFARALHAMQNIVRPETHHNRHVAATTTMAMAAEQRDMIAIAERDARNMLSELKQYPAEKRAAHMELEGLDATDVAAWTEKDWTDPVKLGAKVEADLHAWAQKNGVDLKDHEARLSAYEDLESAYNEVHISFLSAPEDFGIAPENDFPYPIVYTGRWRTEGYGERESRDIVVRTEAGFHSGISAHPIFSEANMSAEPEASRDPKAVIAEARAARVATAFDEMADAVIAGERPQFRTEEQAAAFRRDIEAHYGQGAMERLRSGDSTDLSRDVSDPARVAIMGAAVRMMADSHAALRDAAPEHARSQAAVIDRDSGPDLDL